MHSRFFARVAGFAAVAALVLGAALPAAAATNWRSGQRMFAGFSVEPAVDMATGNQIFLKTPNNAPTNANARAHAPLYLVLYPTASTIDPATLNCTPANCDHARAIPAYSLLGHDHLVGIRPTGDFNVAWDVYAIVFTREGFADGAINHRILTSDELTAALMAGDVVNAGFRLSFNCTKTPITTYLLGTPFGG